MPVTSSNVGRVPCCVQPHSRPAPNAPFSPPPEIARSCEAGSSAGRFQPEGCAPAGQRRDRARLRAQPIRGQERSARWRGRAPSPRWRGRRAPRCRARAGHKPPASMRCRLLRPSAASAAARHGAFASELDLRLVELFLVDLTLQLAVRGHDRLRGPKAKTTQWRIAQLGTIALLFLEQPPVSTDNLIRAGLSGEIG